MTEFIPTKANGKHTVQINFRGFLQTVIWVRVSEGKQSPVLVLDSTVWTGRQARPVKSFANMSVLHARVQLDENLSCTLTVSALCIRKLIYLFQIPELIHFMMCPFDMSFPPKFF